MLIVEYSQYDKYLSNKKFMKYFNVLKKYVSELYPQINPNLELIIDQIYSYYKEEYKIDDLVNRLFYEGHILQFTNVSQP